jgi:hypothetical protein
MEVPFTRLRGFNGRVLCLPSLPRAVALSFARPLLIIAVLCVSLFPSFIVGRSGPKWAQLFAFGWALISILFLGKLGPVALQLWRFRHIYPRFSIIALRPFHHQVASYLYRSLVAPVLGCYGVVNVVSDESFVRSEGKLDDRALDVRIMGDGRTAMSFSDEEWQKKVIAQIANSDLAVIDLSIPSVNLLWETARCIQFLPPHRILFVGVRGIDWKAIMKLMQKYLKEFPPNAHPTDMRQPIEYSGLLFQTWRFRLRIFQAIWSIRRLDRTVAANGTWHSV